MITAAVPGETSAPGLTIATSEVFKVEASQGYETTEEGTLIIQLILQLLTTLRQVIT